MAWPVGTKEEPHQEREKDEDRNPFLNFYLS
jgi:hypothetical protein